MRVVKLKTVFLGETVDIVAIVVAPVTQGVLEAGRCKKILLTQSQLLAVFGRRVRIQHHRDVLGLVLRRHGVGVTPGVEFFEVEFVRRGRGP
jgi:hypothetical protein